MYIKQTVKFCLPYMYIKKNILYFITQFKLCQPSEMEANIRIYETHKTVLCVALNDRKSFTQPTYSKLQAVLH